MLPPPKLSSLSKTKSVTMTQVVPPTVDLERIKTPRIHLAKGGVKFGQDTILSPLNQDLRKLSSFPPTSSFVVSETIKKVNNIEKSLFSAINMTEDQDHLTENEELINQMDKYVESLMVQDRAIIGRMTKIVKIRDPCTGNLIASIRNPKARITSYTSMEGVIDMEDYIEKRKLPIFYSAVPPLTYSDAPISWDTLLELIESKKRQKEFWDFIERLR